MTGSIPACAGEPGLYIRLSTLSPVYPRVCGGTRHAAHFRGVVRGLSPRVRGNLRVYGVGSRGLSPRVRGNHFTSSGQQNRTGSIPACAGEPPSSAMTMRRTRVYPRVCGGTDHELMPMINRKGLSPRVRGNLNATGITIPTNGSIPACAGEPIWRPPKSRLAKVYPRVCGGTPACTRASTCAWGLSPRVRGNQ